MAGVWSSSLLPQEIELVSPPTNAPTTQTRRPRGRIPPRGICLVRVESVESAVGKKFETGDREISGPGLIGFHHHHICLATSSNDFCRGARQGLNQQYSGGAGRKRLVNRFEVRLPTQRKTRKPPHHQEGPLRSRTSCTSVYHGVPI
jgi:hypothetical protein